MTPLTSSLVTSDLSTTDARTSNASGVGGVIQCAHAHDILEGEARGEHAQAPEQNLLGVGELIEAPVDGHAQRLMTRERGAASPGEQREPVAEAVKDLLDAEDAGPDCCKLDRQRQTVEPPAHGGDGGAVRMR